MIHRRLRLIVALAGLGVAFGLACRRASDQDQSGPVPAREAEVPEEYRFLSLSGVGVESLDSIWARLPYDSVYLRREPCFGACPMYEATLYRGGKARYTGTRFVERIGSFQGEVTVQDYGRLAYLMDRFAFMAFPDSFSVPYTDLPGATMAAGRRPGGSKAVHDYGYVGPVELWTLMEVFDGVLGRIQWEKVGP